MTGRVVSSKVVGGRDNGGVGGSLMEPMEESFLIVLDVSLDEVGPAVEGACLL